MTVIDLITKSLRLIGRLGAGETAQIEDANTVLHTLNEMLESWRNDRLMVYAVNRALSTLTPAHDPHTIGSTGADISAERPVAIEGAGRVEGGMEYPLEIIRDEAEYARLPDKNQTGTPTALYYRPSWPLGQIHLWPVPSTALQLALYLWQPFSTYSDLTADIALPPGYARALTYNLGVEIAPEFGAQVSPPMAAIAIESKAALMSINAPVRTLRCDPAIGGARRDWDHITGGLV